MNVYPFVFSPWLICGSPTGGKSNYKIALFLFYVILIFSFYIE